MICDFMDVARWLSRAGARPGGATTDDFMEEMRWIQQIATQMVDASHVIVESYYKNVVGSGDFPRELPSDIQTALNRLHELVSDARSVAELATDRYSSAVRDGVGGGRHLSREQFHLVAAQIPDFFSHRTVGLGPFDDYQVFSMMCYEDDEQWVYINPGLAPPEPIVFDDDGSFSSRIRARFGISPEEVRKRHLSPEQEVFFRQHLPEVYSRFRDAPSGPDSCTRSSEPKPNPEIDPSRSAKD